ncbi:DNA-directed RNA polymerase III [Macleaya cordata]|uniref:DNA-directed RNA polymerase III n=1 Tax=Macleaya cordata TaxID=56857 RepID=A0A200PMI6_MACCD|nr:DNA-directed RNA polymerase III [Macleaya cordata]
MAFRGRGRGRGRGGFGGGFGGFIGNPEPFTLFPEDVQLPDITGVTEEKALIYWNWKLQNYWKSSPYYLEAAAKKSQDTDIERYSDRNKPNKAKRAPLSSHLNLTPAYFPLELIEGTRRVQHDQRNVRWNPESDQQKFDLFEKLEKKYQDEDGKGAKEKKEAENEDDDEEGIEEEDEEFSDDGDYNQNIDFDDDEDDFNMDEGGNDDDEGIY